MYIKIGDNSKKRKVGTEESVFTRKQAIDHLQHYEAKVTKNIKTARTEGKFVCLFIYLYLYKNFLAPIDTYIRTFIYVYMKVWSILRSFRP